MARDYLLVDGYNVINAWDNWMSATVNLEHARDKLIELLSGYGAYKGLQVKLVFDAQRAQNASTKEEERHGIVIVYTREGLTADSYIERLAYQLVRQGERVYVVTSDGAEQMTILGAGAYRISCRELYQDVAEVEKLINSSYAPSVFNNGRQEVHGRLDIKVSQRLEDIRRNRYPAAEEQ